MTRTWPPADVLLTVMSIRAAGRGATGPVERVAEPFEGDLAAGIDVKAIARARARGDQRVFVRHRSSRLSCAPDPLGPFPVVFLFRPGPAETSAWHVHAGPLSLFEGHVTRPDRLQEVIRRTPTFVDGVTFFDRIAVPAHLSHVVERSRQLRGIVLFTHCPSTRQEARWLEDSGYERCPLLEGPLLFGPDLRDLGRMYRSRFGISLDEGQWESTLVRLALPYAPGQLNVVAPDGFSLRPKVHRDARRLGVTIRMLPMSLFDREQIRTVSVHHDVMPFDDLGHYAEEVEEAFGEQSGRYEELLPQRLRDYGVDRSG